MPTLSLQNFQIEMEEVYLPAFREGVISEQRKYLISDIKQLVSDNNQWVGLMSYLLGEDAEPREMMLGTIRVMALLERDRISLSRLNTLLVAAKLADGGNYDDVIAYATRAVVLDRGNEIAKLIVIDLLQGESPENIRGWLDVAADDVCNGTFHLIGKLSSGKVR